MNFITRYIVAELLKVLLFTLMIMTGVLLTGFLVKEAVSEGLGVVAITRLLPYFLLETLRYSIPVTILLAACAVFGRISAANEIVAIKSLGLSPMVVVWPALFLGVAISCVTVWLNDVAITWGKAGINRVVLQSIEQVIYGRLKTQKSYSNQRGLAIHVKEVDGKRMIMPTMSFQPPGEKGPVVITADEAQMQLNADSDSLLIIFTNMVVDSPSFRGLVPGRCEYEIPLSAASRKGRDAPSPSDLPMVEIGDAIHDTANAIKDLEQKMAANAAFDLAGGDFQSLTESAWQEQLQKLESLRARLIRLRVEPWRRWATGFSCLFFVLIGVPAAVVRRYGDFLTNFIKCFAPIAVGYYPLFILGLNQAKSGQWWPCSVWIANMALLVPGLWMMRRMLRH